MAALSTFEAPSKNTVSRFSSTARSRKASMMPLP